MASIPYTLYYHPYSLWSIIVRYIFAIRGQPKNLASALTINEHKIDIMGTDHLTEDYLCNINPKGQVPALTGLTLDAPITDSLGITRYFATMYPSLMPEAHRSEIRRLLADLHQINLFSLSMKPDRGGPAMQKSLSEVQRIIDSGVSEKYKRALEYKIKVIQQQKIDALAPEYVQSMVERARQFLENMQKNLPAGAHWLFGLSQPSVLDAHLIPVIARMHDVGRDELVPEKLQTYAEAAQKTSEWRCIVPGRTMMW